MFRWCLWDIFKAFCDYGERKVIISNLISVYYLDLNTTLRPLCYCPFMMNMVIFLPKCL